jgi:hypothetical protein
MPEAPSDIDYTVDMGRHETMFRANTPKGEEFLGGGDLTMSNDGCPLSRADGQIVFLTASKTDPAPRYWSKGEVIGYKRARLQQLVQRRPLNGNPRDAVALEQRNTLTAGNVGALMMSTERALPWRVSLGSNGARRGRPLYSNQRTLAKLGDRSASCQQATSRIHSSGQFSE